MVFLKINVHSRRSIVDISLVLLPILGFAQVLSDVVEVLPLAG